MIDDDGRVRIWKYGRIVYFDGIITMSRAARVPEEIFNPKLTQFVARDVLRLFCVKLSNISEFMLHTLRNAQT